MPRQLHFTPAIAAITFVLCLAAFAFVILVLLPSPFAQDVLPITPTRVGHGALHLGKTAVLIVVVGYAVGIVGWLATLGLRCDGMHRLSSVLEHPRDR
jgi:hypothetical protein